MPLINKSTYNPKNIFFESAHLSTIIPAKFKKYPIPKYERERIELEDGDFLDLDWRKQNHQNQLVILCHGLEGNTTRTYMNTCSDYFFQRDFNVLAWNYRSCGGEMNRLKRLYHHGSYDDLETVIDYATQQGFQQIFLVGFSMGGALVMNYLGNSKIPEKVKAAVGISVPISLSSSSNTLKKFPNVVYFKNFKRTLIPKLKEKAKQFPGELNEKKLDEIKSFDEIDDYFTAPMHQYKNKEDYYEKASPKNIIKKIKTPCLVINAKNDPFLGDECYDTDLFENQPYVYFEQPTYGGHCGFPLSDRKHSWADRRAYNFIMKYLELS